MKKYCLSSLIKTRDILGTFLGTYRDIFNVGIRRGHEGVLLSKDNNTPSDVPTYLCP